MNLIIQSKVIYNKYITIDFKKNFNIVYYIQILNNKYKVKYIISNKVLFIFKDNNISKNIFKIILNKNHIYIIENNDIILKKIKNKLVL